MLKQKPFPFSVLVLVVLIAIHLAASHFFWYWTYPWLEYVIHILGGLWVASVFLWLASYLNQIDSMKEYRTKSLLIAMVSAVFIGVIWELLENFGQLSAIAAQGYGFNTAVDLLNDLIGGILAYLYFVRRTRSVSHHELHPFYNKIGAHV